jgi:uncharacterized protein YjbI with pentapeptide repeats
LQHQNDINIAHNNRLNDQKIATDQQEEATLKAYLDDMTTLLLDKKLGSQAAADKAASYETAVVARAKTLTALRRLTDRQRKATIMQFLNQAHLIGYLPCSTCSPIVSIIYLFGADLRDVDLSVANLAGANLSGATLAGADLTKADLSGADLIDAHLSDALSLTQQQLDQVDTCKGAILPPGLTCHHNQ